MSIVDILIIIFILLGFLWGWKNGVVKQFFMTVGLVLIFILSYTLKNPLSSFFYKHLPFFQFKGFFKGIIVLNILLYEVLAFIVIFSALFLLLKIVLRFSDKFEEILRATIVLGIPSKILGGILGLLEGFIIAFLILFFLNLPLFNIEAVNRSKVSNFILTRTTILSSTCNNTLMLYEEINRLKDEYGRTQDKDKLNSELLKLFMEYKVIDKEEAYNLLQNDKLGDVRID